VPTSGAEATRTGATELGRKRLSPREGYRLWAPSYEEETAVSALEDRVFRGVAPDVAGRRLLDVGCGTGRRIAADRQRTALAIGLDLVPEMLLAGRRSGHAITGIVADLRRMPIRAESFDQVWCRLVIGHVPDLAGAYRELGRVTCSGGDLIVSDFHAAAVTAGHRRTFRDPLGGAREVQHHVHTPAEHVKAAEVAGWSHLATVEAAAGEPEAWFYERAGRLEQLERERALPLVVVLWLRR